MLKSLNYGKTILLILILNFTVFKSIAQGKVIYKVSFIGSDKLKQISKSSPQFKAVNDFIKNTKPINATLQFNTNKAVYYLNNLHNEANSKLNASKILAGADDKFYTNTLETANYKHTVVEGEELLIKREYYNWKITQETKKIGNYNCFKASYTWKTINGKPRKVIAWFTPELPYNYEPKEFCGLPGLILELETPKGLFQAVEISLNSKINEKQLQLPSDIKVINQEAYDNKLKKSMVFYGFKNK